jgi:hypothetical protein
MSATSTLKYGRFEITDATTLSPESISYLLRYGFSQSLQDSVASVKAKAKKEGKSEAEIDALADETMAKRYQQILDGTVGFREPAGPKLSPFEVEYDRVSFDAIRKLAADKAKAAGVKVTLPKKGSDEYAALRTKLEAKFGDVWKKEAERRVKAAEKLGTESADHDDVFADFVNAGGDAEATA